MKYIYLLLATSSTCQLYAMDQLPKPSGNNELEVDLLASELPWDDVTYLGEDVDMPLLPEDEKKIMQQAIDNLPQATLTPISATGVCDDWFEGITNNGYEVLEYLSSDEESVPINLNQVIRSAKLKIVKFEKNYKSQNFADAQHHLTELGQMFAPHVTWPTQAEKEEWQKCQL